MLKVRRVIIHSLYFYSSTRLLHESILQQGLIIQIKPTLCCIAEEGIGILKKLFPRKQEGRRRGCEIFQHSQACTRARKGTTRKGSHANAVEPGGSRHAAEGLSQRNRLGKRRSRGWELAQRPRGRASFHTLHKLASRKTKVLRTQNHSFPPGSIFFSPSPLTPCSPFPSVTQQQQGL